MNIFRGYGEFTAFAENKREQRTLIVSDVNTRCFSLPVLSLLRGVGCRIAEYRFPEKHLTPEIDNLTDLQEQALDCAYILGVGSGVINDICKYVSSVTEIPYGILATAPSMDGYVSSVSALYKHGKKVTLPATVPQDVLIDTEILRNAPLDMIVAGAGDMIGKYTSMPNAVVLMRLGDFYEVLGEKAKIVADELNLTLTGREVGLPERVPMRIEGEISKAEYQEYKQKVSIEISEIEKALLNFENQKQDNQTGKMSFEQLSELLFQKVDFSQPTLDRQFLEQMIYRIVPNTQDEFAWYLNLLPRQDSDLESFQKICTITVGFEEARQYRKSRKGMLRKNQWRDVTAHIYI